MRESLVDGNVRSSFRSVEGTYESEGGGGSFIVVCVFADLADLVGVVTRCDAGCARFFSNGLADGGYGGAYDRQR